MKKDALVFIEHILECISLIEEYTENQRRSEIIKNYLKKKNKLQFRLRNHLFLLDEQLISNNM